MPDIEHGDDGARTNPFESDALRPDADADDDGGDAAERKTSHAAR